MNVVTIDQGGSALGVDPVHSWARHIESLNRDAVTKVCPRSLELVTKLPKFAQVVLPKTDQSSAGGSIALVCRYLRAIDWAG